MLLVLRAMLAAEPERRPSARRVRKTFAAAIHEIPPGRGDGMRVALHCVLPEKEGKKEEPEKESFMQFGDRCDGRKMFRGDRSDVEKENHDQRQMKAGQMRTVEQAEPLFCSSSVSDLDFGFSDVASDADTSLEDQDEDPEPSLLERDIADIESTVQVERVSPQLSLPDLDVNITGIEGLTFRG